MAEQLLARHPQALPQAFVWSGAGPPPTPVGGFFFAWQSGDDGPMERRPFEPLSSTLDRLRRWNPDEALAQHVAHLRDYFQRCRTGADEEFWKDWQPIVNSNGSVDLLPTESAIRRTPQSRREGGDKDPGQ